MSLGKGRRILGSLALVAGIVSANACGGSYGSNPTPMPNPSPVGSGTADVVITINGMLGAQSYTPNPAAVKVGQTVAWRNADSMAHTATGATFDTGALAAGQTSPPITFTAAGNLDYHCTFHPSMIGTLSVTQ